MSEEENTTGEARGSPVVVIESASSKYKATYKPSEMQDETTMDLHQKQAPAIASLAENWKESQEATAKGLKESEIGMPSDRRKVAKKLSQGARKERDSHSLVAIPMTPIETESKTGETMMMPTTTWKAKSSVTPIPDIGVKKKDKESKEDDKDSITSEITELRTPEAAKKISDWDKSNLESVNDLTYEDVQDRHVKIEDSCTFQQKKEYDENEYFWTSPTSLWMLERKLSMGPFTGNMPYAVYSGVTISTAQKSLRNVNAKSGICFTKPARGSHTRTKLFGIEIPMALGKSAAVQTVMDDSSNYCLKGKGKLNYIFGKMKHAFNI